MADRHVDDRFISSESGQIVSDEFAKENPETTYLRSNFVGGKPVTSDTLDPRLTPVIQALEGMVKEPEDFNVAEFAMDAHMAIDRLYMEVQRGRER